MFLFSTSNAINFVSQVAVFTRNVRIVFNISRQDISSLFEFTTFIISNRGYSWLGRRRKVIDISTKNITQFNEIYSILNNILSIDHHLLPIRTLKSFSFIPYRYYETFAKDLCNRDVKEVCIK